MDKFIVMVLILIVFCYVPVLDSLWERPFQFAIQVLARYKQPLLLNKGFYSYFRGATVNGIDIFNNVGPDCDCMIKYFELK